MEPYNDGVTDHSKAAPDEDTHVRTQGDDVQVDDNGIVEPYIVGVSPPYCRSSCVDQDVGEARTRFARPASPDRSCPRWTPLDSIDDTDNPIEDRKANHQVNANRLLSICNTVKMAYSILRPCATDSQPLRFA
ncbi:unnamed protein product [Heligmosomoides polygyrus]|uniref:Uncharacterized protein n=1 Tax=Heligmosomoides polygyrus TaxID=6339 RepID=A0A183GWP5_HELPZ|nr:unnamed protein product [Heligmosomoides polygyrus]